jgi:hypothetical protein
MSNSSSFAISPSPIIKNPTVFRYVINVANTEETFSLPSGTKAYIMKNTGKRIIQIAYVAGGIGLGQYFQLAPWESQPSPGIINQTTTTFYVKAPGLEVLEFDIWR